MAGKSNGTTRDERRAAGDAFVDRRQDAERYRQEAIFLQREAGMAPNAQSGGELMAVARRFADLAASIELMRARKAPRR
jgi:hypothetical protein